MKPIEQIYISAVRYALGRMSYIVGETVQFMLKAKLGKQCQEIMLRDIDEAFQEGRTGLAMDSVDWLKLREHLLKMK